MPSQSDEIAATEWLCRTCAERNKRSVLWRRDDGDYDCTECGSRFHRAVDGLVELVERVPELGVEKWPGDVPKSVTVTYESAATVEVSHDDLDAIVNLVERLGMGRWDHLPSNEVDAFMRLRRLTDAH